LIRDSRKDIGYLGVKFQKMVLKIAHEAGWVHVDSHHERKGKLQQRITDDALHLVDTELGGLLGLESVLEAGKRSERRLY
jgi:hypothetical protein